MGILSFKKKLVSPCIKKSRMGIIILSTKEKRNTYPPLFSVEG